MTSSSHHTNNAGAAGTSSHSTSTVTSNNNPNGGVPIRTRTTATMRRNKPHKRRPPSERQRRKTLARLQNPVKKLEARQASTEAAARAWQRLSHCVGAAAVNTTGTSTGGGADLYSVASSTSTTASDPQQQGSIQSSEQSAERAWRRGSRRGRRELNDLGSVDSSSSGGNNKNDEVFANSAFNNDVFDLTTIAENGEEKGAGPQHHLLWNGQPRYRRPRRILHLLGGSSRSRGSSSSSSRQRKQRNAKYDSDQDAQAAWMCGVCGLAFGVESACDKHERQHIKTVVEGLGLLNKEISNGNNSSSGNNNNNSKSNHPLDAAAAAAREPRGSILKPPTAHQFSNLPTSPSGDESLRTANAVAPQSPQGSETVRFAFQNNHRYEEAKVPDDDSVVVHDDDADDGYPGLDADLPSGALVPKALRGERSNSAEVRFSNGGDPLLSSQGSPQSGGEETLLLPSGMQEYVVVADEALYDVVCRAQPMILTRSERHAERDLALLARDKAYYDELSQRAAARRFDPSNRFRSDDENLLGKVQNKLLDAYQLMKEGDGKKGTSDQYTRKKKSGENAAPSIEHNDNTLYVNVMVKNSVQVVRRELQRLAKKRWEVADEQTERNFTRFERFRIYTQNHMVQLAGIALASDFTPRRIAVQLSNDTYRLLTPRLKRRGVIIETEIEYRVGPYFVLAVNINTIDWRKLIRVTHRDVMHRNVRWEKEHREEREKRSLFRRILHFLKSLNDLTVFDAIANILSFLYYFHWIVYLPICWVSYYTFLGTQIRHFILSSVADDIFFYIEEKGMEMEIRVCRSEKQAAFMLSALRELRADGEELKKKRQESESQEKGPVLGPLMGPAIAADKAPAVQPPEGFEVPANLEYVGLELDLAVGFQRLRWAFLSQRSTFVTEALFKTEAKYDNIVMGAWDKHAEHIGEPILPQGVDPADFVGAEKEGEYLMPKSAFVSANMSYETHILVAYNDYCFCLKKRSKNPDAPFGKTFVAWTQYVVVNTGNNTCKLTCSVEAEFPNGEPMVSRQIRSGMRAGTGELFVLTGETITKYADEFP